MRLLILNAVLGLLAGFALAVTGVIHWGWSIPLALLVFIVGQRQISRLLHRWLDKRDRDIMDDLCENQKKPQQQTSALRGNAIDNWYEDVNQAIAAFIKLKRVIPWIPSAKHQISAQLIRLYWASNVDKDFKKVDALFADVRVYRHIQMEIKITRMYMLKAETDDIRMFFRQHIGRVYRSEKNVLYSLLAWILIQRKRIESAADLLAEAVKETGDAIIKRNQEHLANNRVSQFSNADFGYAWYYLRLEKTNAKIHRHRPSHFTKRYY
ncbi:MAG: hypothetical protein FWG50_02985 [Kiritimatiellaeota bacterium]|nr:hypothetical protein [Kiritimatiellota bacterium]